MQSHFWNSLLRKAALSAAVLGGFLLVAGAPAARADGPKDSRSRLERANWQLHEAIEQFGYNSSEARYWRHEQQEALRRLQRSARSRARQEREWRKHHREGSE